MYAKVFSQMYDGSLCTQGPWQALVTFQQFLVLADQEGVVDMTAEAISRRTTIPLEIIAQGIACLLLPDKQSRTPTEDGRRIVPLSSCRDWGWRVVNYTHYRLLKREADRRDYHRDYWHKRKTQQTQQTQPITEAEANTEAKAKTPKTKTVPASVPVSALVDAGFDEATAAEFIRTKSERKAPLTERAWRDHLAESKKAGWTPQAAAEKLMAKTWKGFEARYVAEDQRPSADGETAAQRYKREQVAHMTGGILGRKLTPVVPDYIDAETNQRIA